MLIFCSMSVCFTNQKINYHQELNLDKFLSCSQVKRKFETNVTIFFLQKDILKNHLFCKLN